jgi:DNA-binding NarL/FixJ family response regulator
VLRIAPPAGRRAAADSTIFGGVDRPSSILRVVPDDAPRVVLADDHHFFRDGLHAMLERDGMAVVGEAADGAEVVALALELAPDVVVMDLEMPKTSGIETLRQIVAACPDTQVVVLTVSAEDADVIEALAAGACGCILKDAQAGELVAGIRHAAGGHAVLPRGTVRALVARPRTDDCAATADSAEQATTHEPALTARELEVLRLVASGADNAAIGRELSISRHTVKHYVSNIFEKLGVRSRVEAAVYAVRAGLV